MHWRLNKHFCLITIRCDIQSFFKRHTFRLTMIRISRRVQDKAHGIGPCNPGEKNRNNMEIRIPKFTWGRGVFQCLLNRGEGGGVDKEKKIKIKVTMLWFVLLNNCRGSVFRCVFFLIKEECMAPLQKHRIKKNLVDGCDWLCICTMHFLTHSS